MATIKAARAAHPLAPAVLKQLGGGAEAVETALEAGNHGADAGWPGFCYYSSTCEFTARHRRKIADAVEEVASDFGTEAIPLIRSFGCVDEDTPEEAIVCALWSGRRPNGKLADDVMLVENALAWFALEEVGRAIEAI